MKTHYFSRGLLLPGFLLLLAGFTRVARADVPPPLEDILNATQLDVRSSPLLPRPNKARVLDVHKGIPIRQTFQTGRDVTRIARIAIWFAGWNETWTEDKSL